MMNRAMMTKYVLLLAFVAVLAAGPAAAEDPINQTLFGSVAIEGFDPVAYFDEERAIKGSKKITYEWMGAVWRFSTADRRARFEKEPERFAPQYGGYCAWAVSQGKTAGIDPEAFTLHDGKLYLNYNAKIQEKWQADMLTLIEAADRNWPSVIE